MNTSEKARLFESLCESREITVNPFFDILTDRYIYDIRSGLKKYSRSAPKQYANARWCVKARSMSGVSCSALVDALKNARNAHNCSAVVYLDGVCVWG